MLSITHVGGEYFTMISQYTYGHDNLGRRTSVVYEGPAFDQDHLFNWGYNPRSELVLAEQHEGKSWSTKNNRKRALFSDGERYRGLIRMKTEQDGSSLNTVELWSGRLDG